MKQRKQCKHCEGRGEFGNGFYDRDGAAETVKCPADCGGTGNVVVCARGKECLPQDCTCGMPASENGGRTGWPPGMLQDNDQGLSKALASKPDAPLHAREAAAAIGVGLARGGEA